MADITKMYHGSSWNDTRGGADGILQAHSSETHWNSQSRGAFNNIVNLTVDIGDAEDYMMASTFDLGFPGILFEVDASQLDPDKLRPNDLVSWGLIDKGYPEDGRLWTKEMIKIGVDYSLETAGYLSYEGTIKNEITQITRISKSQTGEEIREQFRPHSPEHIAAIMSIP